ncbi:hypothetical protein F0562_033598 [Nyssa sinensis]|uniref:Uncharacterized protein n=1 Tax=Nyssa sinensis TaxID=561372 RepID=A0A5J5AF76_9ASTE|nr:hypothetical protein F0562_033598 [Nyssa sinensis]
MYMNFLFQLFERSDFKFLDILVVPFTAVPYFDFMGKGCGIGKKQGTCFGSQRLKCREEPSTTDVNRTLSLVAHGGLRAVQDLGFHLC